MPACGPVNGSKEVPSPLQAALRRMSFCFPSIHHFERAVMHSTDLDKSLRNLFSDTRPT